MFCSLEYTRTKFDSRSSQTCASAFAGGATRVRVVQRDNLPSPVVAGTTYRNVYVAVELVGRVNAECLSNMLGVGNSRSSEFAGGRQGRRVDERECGGEPVGRKFRGQLRLSRRQRGRRRTISPSESMTRERAIVLISWPLGALICVAAVCHAQTSTQQPLATPRPPTDSSAPRTVGGCPGGNGIRIATDTELQRLRGRD